MGNNNDQISGQSSFAAQPMKHFLPIRSLFVELGGQRFRLICVPGGQDDFPAYLRVSALVGTMSEY
jgi:hypothetical protein